jgi:predicted  nucleic acid-binding Zn-ribbon protein
VPTHSGDKAEETATFTCLRCGEAVRITKGERVPSCSNCGSSSFQRDEEADDAPGRDTGQEALKPEGL